MALLKSSPCIYAASDKPSKLCDTFTLPFLLSGAKRNFHPDVHIRKKLSIKFSRFIGSSVALLYNVPNNST